MLSQGIMSQGTFEKVHVVFPYALMCVFYNCEMVLFIIGVDYLF